MNTVTIYCVLCLFFLYTCLRAWLAAVFHDEAVTFLYHSLKPIPDILFNIGPFAPNNHIPNTLLIKLFINIFGVSEFVIRIPALIGHALYLFGTYKILQMLFDRKIFCYALLILLSNPFLLEMFSAARGYALGLGFMTLGLFFLLKQISSLRDDAVLINTFLSGFFMVMATFSNFSFIHVLFAAIASAVIGNCVKVFSSEKKISSFAVFKRVLVTTIFPISATLIFLYFLCASPIESIIKGKEYYSGGANGFWADTVQSLIRATLYGKTYAFINASLVLQTILVLIITASIFYGLKLLLQYKNKKLITIEKYFLTLICLLFFTVFFVIVRCKITGSKFIMDRSALYLIPIFYLLMLTLGGSVLECANHFLKRTTGLFIVGAAVISFAHFLNCINYRDYYISPSSASARQAVLDIVELNGPALKDAEPKTIVTHWVFTPMINFYKVQYNLFWLDRLPYYPENFKGNYYFIFNKNANNSSLSKDFKDDLNLIDFNQLSIVKNYTEFNTILAVPLR